jgi:hypothetical protein
MTLKQSPASLAAGIVLALAAAVLAGCGGGGSATPPPSQGAAKEEPLPPAPPPAEPPPAEKPPVEPPPVEPLPSGPIASMLRVGDPVFSLEGPAGMRNPASTATLLVDGRVLVTLEGRAQIFDPSSRTWRETARPLRARSGFPSATLLDDGSVLLAGGQAVSSGEILKSAERFDPAREAWEALPDMIEARTEHMAVRMADGRVLMAGGQLIDRSAEFFDPLARRWSRASDLLHARGPGGTATLLADGRVMVLGSLYPDLGDRIEVLDAQGTTWSDAGRTQQAYFRPKLLPDLSGEVLIAGHSNSMQFESETWDPARGTTTMASFGTRGLGHTATRLHDGRVLVLGGGLEPGWAQRPGDPVVDVDKSLEIYDPVQREWHFGGTTHEMTSWIGHHAIALHGGEVLVFGAAAGGSTLPAAIVVP